MPVERMVERVSQLYEHGCRRVALGNTKAGGVGGLGVGCGG